MTVRNRLKDLIAEKAKRDGRASIPAMEIAKAVGMTRQNMSKWVNNDIKGYDSKTLTAFCRYFNCQVGDLIVHVEEPQPAPEDTPKE